ncbi:MAG: acyltransferase family protein [Pseudomonadota bacterium]|nr:acyltransferase family protein [Pseudomonadota bacterium]
MPRRHDIDALRAFAFALLILYHWAMLYVGGEDWGWHLKSPHQSEWLQLPMLLVNRWRMDLIFLISGLSVHFLLRSTPPGRFMTLRTARLMVPLVFGCLLIVPVQPYAQGVANGAVEAGFMRFLAMYFSGHEWPAEAFDGWKDSFTWNHLWYLAYLWVYTLALALLLPLLRSPWGQRLQARLTGLRGWALMTLPALPLLAATFVLEPRFEDTGDLINDWYRHAVYFSMFLYGWWLGTDPGLWSEFQRLRHRSLALAPGLFAVYAGIVFSAPDDAPAWVSALVRLLRNLYIWSALCAILGWAHARLNRPWRWLPWANDSVYPWYVLHQSLIVLLAFVLLPMKLGPVLEPLAVLVGTLLGCWALSDGLVRRATWLRPLFGLRRRPPRGRAAPGERGDSLSPAPPL